MIPHRFRVGTGNDAGSGNLPRNWSSDHPALTVKSRKSAATGESAGALTNACRGPFQPLQAIRPACPHMPRPAGVPRCAGLHHQTAEETSRRPRRGAIRLAGAVGPAAAGAAPSVAHHLAQASQNGWLAACGGHLWFAGATHNVCRFTVSTATASPAAATTLPRPRRF
jgi:hypothetical protein